MRRAVILTALAVEYKAVRDHLQHPIRDRHPEGTIYERGKFLALGKSWEVGIVEIGAGNAEAAVETKRAIDYFKPHVVLFVGVAGGIKDVAIGDVVAATKVYGYESGKVVDETFLPRPNVSTVSYSLEQEARAEVREESWLQRIKGSSPAQKPNAYVGAIAAGDKVISSTNSDIFRLLRSNYGDALAVEMESHGVLKAVRANPEINVLVIRGISDLIDGKSQADAKGFQEIASRHASAFAFEVLAKIEITLESDKLHSIDTEIQEKSLDFLNPGFWQFKLNLLQRSLLPILRLQRKLSLCASILMSVTASILAIGFRLTGILQPLELSFYDRLMRSRPPEQWDTRIAVVGITDRDIESWGGTRENRIPYEKLNQILKNLSTARATVIGLDIFLDPPTKNNTEYENLVKTLVDNKITVTCQVKEDILKINPSASAYPGTRPPPLIEDSHLGFADVVPDNQETNAPLRRHLLKMDKPTGDPTCATEYALSYQLAFRYLNINTKKTPTWDVDGYLSFDKTFFEPLPLDEPMGGYQKIDEKGEEGYDPRGYQIMLNYRASDPLPVSSTELAQDINLLPQAKQDELRKFIKQAFQNKIVLIGYTSQSEYNPDIHVTPYSRNYSREEQKPGVFIHAHMVSQIISAVLDNPSRPLIMALPQQLEGLWIFFCSFLAGLLVWKNQERSGYRMAAFGGGLVAGIPLVFWMICLFFLSAEGIWLPLVPLVLAVWITSGLTSVSIMLVNSYLNKKLYLR